MIEYSPTRNSDPPGLVDTWNESVTGRGAYPVRSPGLFERWIFSKPYFCSDDLLVARDTEKGQIAGFALSGFGPNEDQSSQSNEVGAICCVLVRPEYRRQGIGRELARRAEENLRSRGAQRVVFGSQWPNNPYLYGLYGGSNSPGVLTSEPDAADFIKAIGFHPADSVQILHRKLDAPVSVADGRFGHLRRRYDTQVLRTAAVGSRWQECIWGTLEPVELRMIDKLTNLPAARAVVWELEGFSWRWGFPSAGIMDVQVRPDLRKQGLGKLLLANVLRFLQDQFFAASELQVSFANTAGMGLVKSLGFEPIDEGIVYRRENEFPPINDVTTSEVEIVSNLGGA